MNIDTIIIGIIVIGAAIYSGWTLYHSATNKPDCCGTNKDNQNPCGSCKIYDSCKFIEKPKQDDKGRGNNQR